MNHVYSSHKSIIYHLVYGQQFWNFIYIFLLFFIFLKTYATFIYMKHLMLLNKKKS